MTQAESDHVAREIANQAIARIEGHEKVCAERQVHIVASLDVLQRSVERINNRIITGGGTLIIALIGACGTLLAILMKTH